LLLVICPNLAVDRILEVDVFRPTTVQRSLSVLTQPGGKGSNVARVFRQLGGDVVLTGFVGRRNAGAVIEPLAAMGIEVDAIEAFEENRTCTIIRDRQGSHPTVINEESGEVPRELAERLHSQVDKHLSKARAVFVTGSLSRGLPADFYRQIVERSVAKCDFVGIDATGSALSHGLQGNPHLVKANLEELSSVFGHLGHEPREIADSLSRRQDLPMHTIVTLGESGALLRNDGITWHVKPPRISHTNPIGAGDAFAAGYIRWHLENRSPESALAFAAAVAASDAATPRPGWVVLEEVPSLFAETEVKKW
jgi:tagatose 6-phosphate kinase